MVWLFVIMGLIAFIAAAYGVKSRADEGEIAGQDILAIALLVVAWVAGHFSVFGWAALVIAAWLEFHSWRSPRVRVAPRAVAATPVPPRVEVSAPPPAPAPAPVIEEPAELPPTSGSAYITYVLLDSAQDITGDVLTASLRRGGRRDAALVGKRADGIWQIQFGSQFLELSVGPRIPARSLEYAAAQTFDWPDALDICRDHAATVRLCTPLHANSSRTEIVRLHHQSHAALTEFAPIVGLFWEGPGRLCPASSIPSRAGETGENLDLYVSFRCFPQEVGSAVVSDSVGLHAFGLPDLQLDTPGEPDESVAASLYELASRFFREGCNLEEGALLELPCGPHRLLVFTQSRYDPHRKVAVLGSASPARDQLAPEKLGHDAIGDQQAGAGEPDSISGDIEQSQT